MNYRDGFSVLLVMLSGFLLLFGLCQIFVGTAGFLSIYEIRLSHIAIGVASTILSLFLWGVGKQVGAKA